MKATSWLYRAARLFRDVEVIASGKPGRMLRRAKNKVVGRKIVRKLWKFPF